LGFSGEKERSHQMPHQVVALNLNDINEVETVVDSVRKDASQQAFILSGHAVD